MRDYQFSKREQKERDSWPFPFDNPLSPSQFPIGARVLVDGRDEAIVKDQHWNGCSSQHSRHYHVSFVEGDENVRVPWDSVGVDRK